MRNVLQLCREYGQSPGWWDGLEKGTQALLLADLRLRNEATRG